MVFERDSSNPSLTNQGDTISYYGIIPYRKGSLWGFYSIDKGFITEIIYDEVRMFDEFDRAEVSLNGKWGVIDNTGKFFIKPLYIRISDCINGIYIARMPDTSFIYNNKGQVLSSFTVPYEYTGMEWLNDSLMPVKKDNNWSLLDIRTGKIHFRIPFAWVSFYHGYFIVGNDKFGMINENGDTIIPIIYDKPLDFNYGLSVIEINNRAGYINEKGEVIIPLKYEPFTFQDCSTPADGTLQFMDGIGRVQLNSKYGYVNAKGKEITKIEYDYAESFRYGVGIVEKNGYYSALDTNGRTLIGYMSFQDFIVKFDSLRNFTRPEPTLDYGRIQKEKYSNIIQIANGLFRVEINGKMGYVDRNGKEYFE